MKGGRRVSAVGLGEENSAQKVEMKGGQDKVRQRLLRGRASCRFRQSRSRTRQTYPSSAPPSAPDPTSDGKCKRSIHINGINPQARDTDH